MAFNIYLAGGYNREVDLQLQELGANRLFSQLNDRNGITSWLQGKQKNPNLNIFVDSGAFSAHTKGKELDVDEYISYVNYHAGMFSVIAQVDTIPGEFGKPKTRAQMLEAPQSSWINYCYMRPLVIDYPNLTPIFHQGEDFSHLMRILETTFDGEHIPYIGISPSNDVSTRDKQKWLEHVFRVIRDSSNPQVKTHAFGMTSLHLLELYPFYSADSTSWIMTSANGGIMTSKGVIVVSEKQQDVKGCYAQIDSKSKSWLDEYVKSFGFSMEQLSVDYKARNLFNASYLLHWAKNYQYKGTGCYQRRLF